MEKERTPVKTGHIWIDGDLHYIKKGGEECVVDAVTRKDAYTTAKSSEYPHSGQE